MVNKIGTRGRIMSFDATTRALATLIFVKNTPDHLSSNKQKMRSCWIYFKTCLEYIRKIMWLRQRTARKAKSAYFSAPITASVNSSVPAWPPTSRVVCTPSR